MHDHAVTTAVIIVTLLMCQQQTFVTFWFSKIRLDESIFGVVSLLPLKLALMLAFALPFVLPCTCVHLV